MADENALMMNIDLWHPQKGSVSAYMNEKVLHTLEYHKITERLQGFASTAMSAELCRNLQPMTDIQQINQALLQTNDALSRVIAHHAPSFGGFQDCLPAMGRLKVGGILSIEELLNISTLLDRVATAKSYSRHKEEPDSLTDWFEALEPLSELNTSLKRCITPDGEISDDASPALRDLRRKQQAGQERIRTELNQLLNNPNVRSCLQDFVITTRNDRYCLPVKAECKSGVPGMVHDQSATGSTYFIEPMSVVKLNNDLKELSLQEQAEIEKILAALSADAAINAEAITASQKWLVMLDFTFAKAALSQLYRCSCPVMNEDGKIDIKKGRHPLIPQDHVVPIDIRLGEDYDLLIITGPNTGGKTVSLKTVGLLTLMGQSGLNIPAMDNSRLAVFKKVYADIGDEQSIEQSLSTFSSHMTNTVKILKYADRNTLILFDEIGAGTDPVEGAALATSILASLHKKGIKTMATTHYSELKVYALSTPGVENACCEFDVESLRPTYRLLIGIPGKSNAFAISSKLGLSDYIIKDAQKRLESQDVEFEDMLQGLENSRVSLDNERAEVKQLQEEAARLKQQLEAERESLDSQRDKILENARMQAGKLLSEAKDYADETIRVMNKHGMTVQELEKSRSKVRDKMKATASTGSLEKAPARQSASHKPEEFTLGTRVKVLSMNLTGTVSTRPDSHGNLFVQMGIIRSNVNIKELEIIQEDAYGNPVSKNQRSGSTKSRYSVAGAQGSGTGSLKMGKSSSIAPEINLLGLTVDEAVAKLDKYLDDAYLAGLPQVRVVHGKGTGALRNGVTSFLKGISYVQSYRLGEHGEGDAGVTIVTFK